MSRPSWWWKLAVSVLAALALELGCIGATLLEQALCGGGDSPAETMPERAEGETR